MDDERHGVYQAQILFEKGFDNVYLLTGGVHQFYEDFPELVAGRILLEKARLASLSNNDKMSTT